eukprot:9461893-Pyramimonas_sp.AAC.1
MKWALVGFEVSAASERSSSNSLTSSSCSTGMEVGASRPGGGAARRARSGARRAQTQPLVTIELQGGGPKLAPSNQKPDADAALEMPRKHNARSHPHR